MALVLIRRLGEMLFVMAGISILVFLIFFASAGGDRGARMGGLNASAEMTRKIHPLDPQAATPRRRSCSPSGTTSVSTSRSRCSTCC